MAAILLGQSTVGEAACTVTSGPRTAALVELYTSEGCSSCPPADAQLNRLHESLDPGAVVVPLALHVNYWDYIGWKDPYAQVAFGTRQDWLVHANGHSAVFTPHFFVGGVESRHWSETLRTEVRRQNAVPAQATVDIQGKVVHPGVLSLHARARLTGNDPHAALYVALTEDKLTQSVVRGENAGNTLVHDHVVRAWLGPIALAAGAGEVQQDVLLDPSWVPGKITAVGFVQNQESGHVLQAVDATACALP